MLIHVSGCAKGCAHPAPAPLTVVGTERGCGISRDAAPGADPAARVDRRDLAGLVAHIAAAAAGRRMAEPQAYLRDGDAIYERSFAIIRAEADLARFSADEAEIAVRMIHACGLVEAAHHIVFAPGLVAAARSALTAGAADPVRCRDGGARHYARAAAGRQRR